MSLQNNWIGQETFSLGHVIKTFGVQGALVVRLSRKVSDIVDIPEWTFFIMAGAPVPFRLRHEEVFLKDQSHLVMAVEDWVSPESIQRFIQAEVWFPGKWEDWFDEDPDDESDLTGFRVLDKESSLEGKVTGFMDIPQNPLLEIDINGSLILLPFRDEYIQKIDHRKRLIKVIIPDDLLHL